MSRLLVLLIALVLPFQFAWSAASAYCQHETGEQESRHIGHHVHVHVHKAESEKPSSAPWGTDSDCAACHGLGMSMIVTDVSSLDVSTAASFAVLASMPPFASALARAPDRPQWPRPV